LLEAPGDSPVFGWGKAFLKLGQLGLEAEVTRFEIRLRCRAGCVLSIIAARGGGVTQIRRFAG
jgi:hypothetical protein